MKNFLDDNFLLGNKTSEWLYHEVADNIPIIDYHCHLSPKEIAEDKRYKNITEIWLGGDHYKWRAMRSNGVEEYYITGNATDKEKFMKWAETIPYCIGNPLYHWTHLELQRYFGINEVLSPKTSEDIWEKCNEVLNRDDFSVKQLIQSSNVKTLCTTDDPVDSLQYHLEIKKDQNFDVKVLPTFRPDKAVNIERKGFCEWIEKLSQVSAVKINDLEILKSTLVERLNFFHDVGCRLSDHACDIVTYRVSDDLEIQRIFKKALEHKPLSDEETEKFKTHMIVFFGREYAKRGWAMQLHIGTIRDNNERMFKRLGPDTGFDSIGDRPFAEPLARLLNTLNLSDELPKTILYTINPCANEVLGTIMGCFQGSIPSKIQFGASWWFNGHMDGMERQMIAFANLGLLGRFVGMLTDSRCFLSYTRHEYFRRILCNLIGQWVENGELPSDKDLLESTVENICYINALNYFGMSTKG